MEPHATVAVSIENMRGVVAKKRILEIDGIEHYLGESGNQIVVSPGEHKLRALMLSRIEMEIYVTKTMVLHIADGQRAALVYHMVGGRFSREFRLELRGHEAPPPAPIAAWAWAFVVPCIAIPVVSLGGAIPAILGVLGAGGCLAIAKEKKLSKLARIGICIAITGACWAAFGLMIATFFK